MTGFDSKRRIALDRLDDDDIQIYAQPEGKIMTEEEARTLEAMKYAASMGHGRMVREMKIAPFTIKEALAQPDPLADAGKPIEHIDVLKLALDLAIMHHSDDGYAELRSKVRQLAKEALAQTGQEPVAWITPDGEGFRIRFSPPKNEVPLGWDALYTTPPKRPWVGLTQNDIYKISEKCGLMDAAWEDVMNAVEAELKELNT